MLTTKEDSLLEDLTRLFPLLLWTYSEKGGGRFHGEVATAVAEWDVGHICMSAKITTDDNVALFYADTCLRLGTTAREAVDDLLCNTWADYEKLTIERLMGFHSRDPGEVLTQLTGTPWVEWNKANGYTPASAEGLVVVTFFAREERTSLKVLLGQSGWNTKSGSLPDLAVGHSGSLMDLQANIESALEVLECLKALTPEALKAAGL